VDHVQLNYVLVVLQTENKQKLSSKLQPDQGSEPLCNELTKNHQKVATAV